MKIRFSRPSRARNRHISGWAKRSGNACGGSPFTKRGVIFSILIYVLAFATRLFFFPMPMHHMPGMIIVGVASLVGVVFTILLAVELFGPAGGILIGLLVLFPCLGLIVLLVINSQATAELRRHGIRVGLLGADMSQF